MNIAICDDEKTSVELMDEKIRKCMDETLKGEKPYRIDIFGDGESLIKEFEAGNYADVVLLDIDMPGMDGFEAASHIQRIREETLILFVTNYEDKVYQSYEYHPFWFIRKSRPEDLDGVLPKIVRKIEAENEKKNHVIELKADNETIRIDINRVIYIMSFKHDIIIKDSEKGDLQVRCKISSIENELLPFNIIRVQCGVLVNCRYISKITSREVVLTTGERFGLSRSCAEFVKSAYHNYIRSSLIRQRRFLKYA